MEIGAVRQAFNNEVILLKKKLNQAKIQVIHKLTRKAKTLTEKKAPEPLKEKLKRKAQAAIKEVLIIKHLKAKDVARFILTHTGKLSDVLNQPIVNDDKACARLLLHKTIEDKYNFLRDKFSNIPIDDLFMTKAERRKKEAIEKKHKKEKAKKKVSSQGNWNLEEINEKVVDDDMPETDIKTKVSMFDKSNENEDNSDMEASGSVVVNKTCFSNENQDNDESDLEAFDNDDSEMEKNVCSVKDCESEGNSDIAGDDIGNDLEQKPKAPKKKTVAKNNKMKKSRAATNGEHNLIENKDEEGDIVPGKFVRLITMISSKQPEKPAAKVKANEKQKPAKSKKNLNEKIAFRTFKKQNEDLGVENNKVIDPFFITSTGENYMSLAEPRQPDEVKETHKQGNRQMRRAAIFGYNPRIKPKFNNNNNQHNFRDNKVNKYNNESNYKTDAFSKNKRRFNDKDEHLQNNQEPKEEKLHPSWEAKKKKSGILPFEGKKIVFDDS